MELRFHIADPTRSSPGQEFVHMLNYKTVLIMWLVFVGVGSPVWGQTVLTQRGCESYINGIKTYSACQSEPVFLLRSTNFTVSVTPTDFNCGRVPQQYCTLGAVRNCETCDASQPDLMHPYQYMYDSTPVANAPILSTWWQSVTWQNLYPIPLEVNITFTFNKQYELQDDLKITFKNSRPQSMVLEKSKDYGATWEPLQYYEKSCKDMYLRGVPRAPTEANPTAVICTQEYSRETPYENAELAFPLVSERLKLFLGPTLTNYQNLYMAFNRTKLNEFLTFTDIRIRLLYPQTDGLERLKKPEDLIKYYYAIGNVEIVGGCACNLHARFCMWSEGRTICSCEHNTAGDNCEKCLPLFNQRPWRPGYYLPYPDGTANECQACQCFGHADSCEYNAALKSGVCVNCTHNTTGINCQLCATGFYKNSSAVAVPESPYICIDCNCNQLGVSNNSTRCLAPFGQCECKSLVTGAQCDRCIDRYYGLLDPFNAPGTCKECRCVRDGTVGYSDVCEKNTGQCPCKPNIEGRVCNQCKIGYYNFPAGRSWDDCTHCGCDSGGSLSPVCNTANGTCSCRPGVTGARCDSASPGFYAPALDALQYQPTVGTCVLDTNINSPSFPFSGRTFALCNENQNIQFENIVPTTPQQGNTIQSYRPTLRYSLNSTDIWPLATLTVTVMGNSGVDITPYQARTSDPLAPSCTQVAGQTQSFSVVNLSPGYGKAWISPVNMRIDVRCSYSLSLTMGPRGLAQQPVLIDSIVMMPDYMQLGIYSDGDNTTKAIFDACARQIAQLASRASAMTNLECQKLSYSAGTGTFNGGTLCNCDPTGTLAGTQCAAFGGQCSCKPGVTGRRCDACAPGFYAFSAGGCLPCNCNGLGSQNGVCDYVTGQCPCKTDVAIAGQNNTMALSVDLQCRACRTNYYGFATGQGCLPCLCSPGGGISPQCDDAGMCRCKPTIGSNKCDTCLPGYFSFSPNGCLMCNCSSAGSLNVECDAISGQCNCKNNTFGLKCDQCNVGSFNLQASNPQGCQKCFCYGHGTLCSSATGFAARLITTDDAFGWERMTLVGLISGLYMVAPPNFHGNHYYAYGNTINIKIRGVLGIYITLDREKIVVLEGNGGQLVYYNGSGKFLDGSFQSFDLLLHQNYWHFNDSQNPTDFQFHAILADITNLYVQTRFGVINAIVSNVSMVTAGPASPGEPQVTNVENCTCDVNRRVMGQSCQMCATGFQRQTVNGSVYETCRECSCTLRGETTPPMCDENTGMCLNCRNGTTGFNCEQCAPNVIGPNCDGCADEFWGLGRDGCRNCSCDPVGSIAKICDKISGNCTCRPHVVSRTCGECEDNYNQLSITGCVECDGCYSLVGTQVNLLREMRANITDYVTNLRANDTNMLLGPFTARLQNAVGRMALLINFLNSANRVSDAVGQQVARLNATLQGVQESLDIDVPNTIFLANASIKRADDYILTAQSVNFDTNATVVEAYGLLSGQNCPAGSTEGCPLVGSALRVDSLVASLQAVEQNMRQISGGAMADVTRIQKIVERIEADANAAQQLSQTTLATTRDAQTLHQNTSLWIRNLQVFETQVAALGQRVFLLANNTYNNASDMHKRVSDTYVNATSLSALGVNIRELEANALALRVAAEQLNAASNAANAVAIAGLKAESDQANVKTADLLGQLVNIKSVSDQVLAQVTRAYITAKNMTDIGDQVFKDAETMLQVMQNFQDMAKTVERNSNASILEVQKVASSSNEAITSAVRLQQNLVVSRNSAQTARDVASLAKQDADAKVSFMFPVNEQAIRLEAEASGLLNDVQLKSGNISNINQTVIHPARGVCNSLEADLQSLAKETAVAEAGANNATNQVMTTQARIAGLQQNLLSIQQLNATELNQLQARVTAAQVDLNSRDLNRIINELSIISANQRIWIDTMNIRKEELRKKIRRLRDVQEQLRRRIDT